MNVRAKKSKCPLGHNHASMLEASVCELTAARQMLGEFDSLVVEQTLRLGPGKVIYRCDIVATKPDGSRVYIEAKGREMSRWPTIKRLWKAHGYGPLEIWKGTARRPVLVQTIHPEHETITCPHCLKEFENKP